MSSLVAPRRILSVWLSQLAVDRWRLAEGIARGEGRDASPLVLIAETAHGPRIEAANDAGRRAGAASGMMLADARALCPALRAVPHDAPGDLAFIEGLSLWARRWGPWSALDLPDGLLVDVTAVAHLFGGEAELLEDARRAFAARRLAARLAIAPTAGAAWALSHYGPPASILAAGEGMPRRLFVLPVAALRLDDEVQTVLRRLGLKTLGDLAARFTDAQGRDALHRRFRNRKVPSANPLIRLDQLLGRRPEPLLPVEAPHVPLVQRRLMEPIRHRALLDQVLADLAGDMKRELERLGQGARRLEIGLWRVDGEVAMRVLELAAATRDPAHICRLFAARLDGVEAGFGIEIVRLQASWVEVMAPDQRDIEAAAENPGTSLAVCIDRLTVRLGKDAVQRPVPHGSHIPERAQRWESLSGAVGTSVPTLRRQLTPPPDHPKQPTLVGGRVGEWAGTVSSRQAGKGRPLKMLDRAETISVLYATPDGYPRRFRWRGNVHDVVRVEGPERIAPEWWRERGSTRLRDYYRVEDAGGRRYWIYRQGLVDDGRGGLPQWFLQGLCA